LAIHELLGKLARQHKLDWKSRTHFYGVAAHLMRLILVDCARRKNCPKRGGPNACLVDISSVDAPAKPLEIDALVEALERLTRFDERLGRIVELRFFAGLTEAETAEVLGVSAKTVSRDWKVARAWLHGELRGGSSEP
jgi:RNA polymerase sigma factor (TIGR02999 family)